MNFYKRHLGDIAKSLSNLSQGQMGAYDLLLDWLYSNEKPLPLAMDELYQIGRCRTKAERENVDRVLRYFDQTEAGYTQKRALEEISKASAQADTNRRIAEEREATKRAEREARIEHEACSGRDTNHQPSQTPDSRLHLPTDTTSPTTPEAAVGVFEGHESPRHTPNPAAPLAIALNRAGVQVTSLNPDLIDAEREGVTAAALVELAGLDEFKGKPATYVIRAARRMHAEGAKPINGDSHATPVRRSAAERVLANALDGERADAERSDPAANGHAYLVGAHG